MGSAGKIFGFAVGATLATGLGVGALSFLQTDPLSGNSEQIPHKLLTSQPTREKLGWIADELPGWAKMDVIAVSDADISSDGNDLTLAATQALNPGLRRMFAGLAREKFAGTYAFSTQGLGKNNVCVMAIPPTDRLGKYYASFISSIPEEELANIPGTGSEWAALMLAHEGSHCGRFSSMRIFGPVDESLAEETHADQDSVHSYYVANKRGLVKTGNLPEVLRDMRALGTFLVFANPRYRTPSKFMLEDATNASLDMSDPYALMNRLRVLTGSDAKEPMPVTAERDIVPVFQSVISAMSLPEGDMAGSMRRAAQNPARLYSTLKALDQKGTFQGNPMQETYVRQFLAAAEKWAPGHFGIGKPVGQTFQPSM